MDFLHKLIADLANAWTGWDTNYRVLAAVVMALFVYLLLRAIPFVLRIVIAVAVVAGVAWTLYPAQTCALPWVSTIEALCPHEKAG